MEVANALPFSEFTPELAMETSMSARNLATHSQRTATTPRRPISTMIWSKK
ncbi:MAG: hypothetical protein HOC28_07870 [Bacteroidetes Order II. Incertae sedis bacterium]|nr:hypothetical protein [Bacteroidetes Order II. bacterium]MBT4052965.1 hypothetical protein [Bacteroidetes Order II. bacterium]MBT4603040.1 hypothetical protein [Bacteroidetes Order II. bacterium]MBT6199241.1 hypothetical protein [Bacteroidetes Order II. bacterium]MBT6423637.1 hypothetical protein [Bacteroidetes Order II. bacterium]